MTTIEPNTWRGRAIRYAPLILWTGLIFFLSSGAGRTKHTSILIRPILLWLFPDITEPSLELAHIIVRKIGHFVGYGILAALSYRAFTGSAKEILRSRRIVFSMLVVLAVAVTDEINQGFYDGRTSSPLDVMLDCAGAATFLLVIFLFSKKRSR